MIRAVYIRKIVFCYFEKSCLTLFAYIINLFNNSKHDLCHKICCLILTDFFAAICYSEFFAGGIIADCGGVMDERLRRIINLTASWSYLRWIRCLNYLLGKFLENERFLGENCLKVDQIGFTFQTVSSRNRPKLSKFQILTCINEANKPRSTWTICHYLKTKFTTQIFTKRFLYLQRKVKLSKN